LRVWLVLVGVIISLGISACGNQGALLIPTEKVYRPPTQIPTEPSTPEFLLETGVESPNSSLRPTPTPSCANGLWFLGDLTIPDGTVVTPGERLDKRWQVQNNGTCNWDEDYRVKLIAGPGMGVPVQQALIPALSGTEVVIRMVLIAPEKPGIYRSAWQAYDPKDNPFGDPFFIEIQVPEPEPEPGGE
jgi:hypothetical protein